MIVLHVPVRVAVDAGSEIFTKPVNTIICRNALHFKHCGVIYRFEQMPKYRHTISIVVNVAFTPSQL